MAGFGQVIGRGDADDAATENDASHSSDFGPAPLLADALVKRSPIRSTKPSKKYDFGDIGDTDEENGSAEEVASAGPSKWRFSWRDDLDDVDKHFNENPNATASDLLSARRMTKEAMK